VVRQNLTEKFLQEDDKIFYRKLEKHYRENSVPETEENYNWSLENLTEKTVLQILGKHQSRSPTKKI
jgi:hypothetical protein